MLDTYLQRTQLLLSDPDFSTYNDGDLTDYINMARGQIAGESKCIRQLLTLDVVAATQQYPFSSIQLGGLTTSCLGVLNVRQISYTVASGYKPVHMRSWPYFMQYILSNPVPEATFPSAWSQLGEGANGTIYTNVLDNPYALLCDTVLYPVPLTDDDTPEAIPYQWTDAVPFYASYFAALTKGKGDMAGAMWQEYQKFIARARQAATPEVLPGNFAQAPDPFMQNRLGLQPRSQGG